VHWNDPPDHVDWIFASDFTAVAYLRAMKDENTRGPARLVVPRSSTVVLVADGYRSKPLELAGDPAEEPPHLTVVLEPGANAPSIQGTVRGGRSARVVLRWIRSRTQFEEALDWMREEVMPELVDRNERPLAAYDVGADGHYSFGGLPPGSYCVDVAAPGRTPRRSVVTVPANDVDFDLAASARLEVLAVDGSGTPCADVKVHVQTKRDACAWSLRTSSDGVAVFPNLPDAEFQLVAARELQDVCDGGVLPFERTAFFPKDDLALVAGETRRVQLALVESVPVTLHVHDINDRSIEGANIAISLQRARVPFALFRGDDDVRNLAGRVFETDIDGEVHLELLPSAWNFEVWADGHHFHRMFMLERGAARRIDLELADD
ncbi:MAG TPA: carboxypeptidase-like regulatory domain-containing protein, partial [Planctomycetota bacterium]|nr:carboxypeptidase-like regulatory domain-containing protein [Planctomycetota bacterium]